MSFLPFHKIEADRSKAMLLLGDHARRDLPDEYGALGLPKSEFERHIAYDIGVEPLLKVLQKKLGVPALMSGFSRLLIDPNRGEDDPTLIMQLSDGTTIAGNYPLSEEERQKRINQFYRPYHDAIVHELSAIATESQTAPFIVSLHSFTPKWRGQSRPWQIGLLWDKDGRAALPLLDMLRQEGDLVVGDNEPYDGALINDTLYKNGTKNGYAHILIEIRQDLIVDEAGVHAWAERLAPMLIDLNSRKEMHEVQHFGTRAY
ncbi:N-formylglutamate amidohydrolase [Bartonella sp. HY406]|uniref:N-formylglutamate amidohydrolase n=1 Tax=Bartonella sp. HY406 TaxID=2979331 RepID=UPI0021C6FB96|nr:N-formylglutamate amidohydrolase [Bartonella sp. HY406]UXN03546.1 N-formylglutamate amidohydrolase [Bartonella sp. HY406]